MLRPKLPGPTSFGPGFGLAAARVLRRAQRIASRMNRFGPAEILAALSETRGPTRRILSPKTASKGLLAFLPAPDVGEALLFAVPDPLGQQIVDTASDWAAAKGRRARPPDLLLAALCQGSPICRSLLKAAGLPFDGLYEQAERLVALPPEVSGALSPIRGAAVLSDEARETFWLRQERLASTGAVGDGPSAKDPVKAIGAEYDAVVRYASAHRLGDSETRALLAWHLAEVNSQLGTAPRRHPQVVPLRTPQDLQNRE